MDKNTKFTIKTDIGPSNGMSLRLEDEITAEALAKICRKDWKKGGGCPVGNVLSCPFFYGPYTEKHKGERPIFCGSVTAEDWIELYSIVNEDSVK